MVSVWPGFNSFWHFFRGTSLLVLHDSLSHQPLDFSEALLELRFLEHPQLQVHQRGQTRRDSEVKLFGVDIGDQSGGYLG
jgi:hypothetical protein